MDTQRYRELYDEWCVLRDWSYGPIFRAKSDAGRFWQLSNQLVENIFDNERKRLGRCVHVKSPWHASFLLAHLQDSLMNEGRGHLLFRGHADASWKLIPSIDRFEKGTQGSTREIVKTFVVNILLANLHIDVTMFWPRGSEHNFTLGLSADAYFPVAQHYGAKTWLLDCTADPSVAVYFATRPIDNRVSQNCNVHMLGLHENSPLNNSFHLKLVPPFFSRPYLQKGVFLESNTRGDLLELCSDSVTVSFPHRIWNSEFKIIRNDEINILPESEDMDEIFKLADLGWIEFLMQYSGQMIAIEKIESFAHDFVKANEDSISNLFKEHIKDPLRYFNRFVEEYEDLMYWICYVVYREPKEAFGFSDYSLEMIVRHNPEISHFIRKMYLRSLADESHSQFRSQDTANFMQVMCEQIEKYLKTEGHEPDKNLTFDSYMLGVSPMK